MKLGEALGADYSPQALSKAKTKLGNAKVWSATPLNARGVLDAATNLPVIGDALSGVMAAYDAAKGDYGSAAMNALGVLPFVSGTFIGKGAKTWDKVKEADAMSRLAKGEDAAKVWKETGYGKAPWDKAARAEIDDSQAVFEKPFRQPTAQEVTKAIEAQDFIRSIDAAKKEARNQHGYTLKGFYDARPGDYEKYQKSQETFRAYNRDFVDPKVKQGYLADFLDHNEAYAAYPKTSIIPTTYNQSHSGGSYMPEMNQMLLGLGDEKSVTLHELQHAIQQREGWARGGSPDMFPDEQTINDARLVAARIARGEKPSEAAKWVAANLGRNPSPQVMDLAMKPKAELHAIPSNPHDGYQRLAGEAEARLTQARMNLTPEQRLAQYPYDPEYFKQATGVDIDKLIVRGETPIGKAFSGR